MTDLAFRRLSTALSANYRLHRELGGGGMSQVFLATDLQLGREVVVKTLPPDLMSADSVERFKREIRTSARLQHPNIVPLLSSGDADGVPYYTMPWVEGASLRNRLQRGRIPVAEGVAILRDMARALAAAHAKGILHRDIKPENVLLSSGAALITDFGVARALTEATNGDEASFRTGTGIAIGTPAYMAPEQLAADAAVDAHADIYAWGLVAHETLTGLHPFAGSTGTSLLRAHLGVVPTRVDALEPEVPRFIADLVAQCLEKDPARRPADAGVVAQALELPGPTSRPSRRAMSPRRALMAGAALAVLVATAAFLLRRDGAGAAPDERMIAVAPFRIGGAAPGVHYLREGMGDLMTPQLHSIPGVTTPSMRVMLQQWRRAGGSSDDDLPDDRALRVAENAGAAQLITGEIVGTANRLTISAQLVRVRDGRVLAPAQVEGPADSAAALAARIVATLLSIRDGGTVDRVRSVVSARPEAISPFLVGEQAYRRGRYLEASQHFAQAYESDTTFALAALRIVLANGWNPFSPVPGPWLDRAWRNRERLRGGDAALLLALTGPGYPLPRPARQYERDLWSAAESANSAELWLYAGDVLFHRGTLSGGELPWRRALDAFRRAEALDSSFVPALEHQSAIHRYLGDTASERAAWNRQRMLDSTGDFFALTDMSLKATHGTISGALRALADLERRGASRIPAAFVANNFASDLPVAAPDDRRLVVGDAFMRSAAKEALVLPREPGTVIEYNAYAINTGRPRPFRVAAFADSALLLNTMHVIAWLAWDGDSASAARSGDELRRWAAVSRDSSYSLLRSSGYFAAGLVALDRGDTAGVDRARAALRGLRAPSTAPWQVETPQIHERLLTAHLTVARRSPDMRKRLEELDSLLMDSQGNRNLVLNLGNVLVSRLWEAAGDDGRAWSAIQRHHSHVGASGFASARLRAKARIAEHLGKREDAISALRTFVMIREKAEPRYQGEVEAARQTLARLERESRGK